MRTLHLRVGVAGLLAFIGSGQLMRHHQPPMDTLSDSIRLIIDATVFEHEGRLYIEILRRSILLAAVFLQEPQAGFREGTFWSRTGLYLLLVGCVLHLVGARRDR